jgi:hypothetical protein
MAINNSSTDQSRTATSTKKPYEKPSFRFEEVFVTTALSCGKITATQSGCGLNLKVS